MHPAAKLQLGVWRGSADVCGSASRPLGWDGGKEGRKLVVLCAALSFMHSVGRADVTELVMLMEEPSCLMDEVTAGLSRSMCGWSWVLRGVPGVGAGVKLFVSPLVTLAVGLNPQQFADGAELWGAVTQQRDLGCGPRGTSWGSANPSVGLGRLPLPP